MLKIDAILWFLLSLAFKCELFMTPPPRRILHGLYISFYCKHLHCDVGILWHPKDILRFSLVLFITHFQSVNTLPTLCIFSCVSSSKTWKITDRQTDKQTDRLTLSSIWFLVETSLGRSPSFGRSKINRRPCPFELLQSFRKVTIP